MSSRLVRASWRPRPAATAISAVVDDEVVVYCERSSRMHCLDRYGSILWALCDGSRTVAQVAAETVELSGGLPEEVRADVDATLRRLYELDILR